MATYLCRLPERLLRDRRISAAGTRLYALITSLSYQSGFCYASNRHLAKKLDVAVPRIQTLLKQLETRGYIRRQNVEKSGKVVRCIFPVDLGDSNEVASLDVFSNHVNYSGKSALHQRVRDIHL